MGETVKLRNQLAGTFGLNDFIEQGDGAATVGDLLRLILPTMDLKDFRRRFRIDRTTVNLLIGEFLSDLRWTVPRGEAWRPRALLYENGDSTSHDVDISLTLPRGADVGATALMKIANANVFGGSSEIVWPLSVDKGTGGTLFQSVFDFVLEPGDSFILRDLTAAAGGTAMRAQFYYELVPEPTRTRSQGVDGVATIV